MAKRLSKKTMAFNWATVISPTIDMHHQASLFNLCKGQGAEPLAVSFHPNVPFLALKDQSRYLNPQF
jgi:hypothetical protein